MNRPHHRPIDRATLILGLIALLLFGRLAQRHVGDSYFLADQVDQLQKFEAALRLEPEGLWGPAMSGTQARALGPFGAFVFGIPVSLGFGIDSIHRVTSLLLALATAVAFFQLVQLNVVLAWLWLIVFTAMRMTWWSAAMFWVNTLLLPLGLLLLALFVACIRRPSLARLIAMTTVLFLALQVHLVALVGVPPVLLAAAAWWREAPVPAVRTRQLVLVVAILAVTALPYLAAESMTGFRNTRAMFSHVDSAVHSDTGEGQQAAMETLALAMDPVALVPERRTAAAIAAGVVVVGIALLVLQLIRRQLVSPDERRTVSQTLWLVTAATVSIAVQALFFRLMGRPLNGLHYAILLAPWYPIPLAALVAALVPARPAMAVRIGSAALGGIAIVLLIFRAPGLADRSAERTPWNYRAITTALDSLCAGQGVQTIEGPGLVDDLTPSYDSVLRYLMKRGLTRCRYDAGAAVVIVANRNGGFEEVREDGGTRFRRELVVPPGLAKYRRIP